MIKYDFGGWLDPLDETFVVVDIIGNDEFRTGYDNELIRSDISCENLMLPEKSDFINMSQVLRAIDNDKMKNVANNVDQNLITSGTVRIFDYINPCERLLKEFMKLDYLMKSCKQINYYGDDPDMSIEYHWDYLVILQKIGDRNDKMP